MPRTPLEAYAFDARFGKRSVFILDPRLPPVTCRVWQPLHRQDNHTGNEAVEKKGDLCRLEYRLLNMK